MPQERTQLSVALPTSPQLPYRLARRAASSAALRPPVGMPRSRHSLTMVDLWALFRSVARSRASGVDMVGLIDGTAGGNGMSGDTRTGKVHVGYTDATVGRDTRELGSP